LARHEVHRAHAELGAGAHDVLELAALRQALTQHDRRPGVRDGARRPRLAADTALVDRRDGRVRLRAASVEEHHAVALAQPEHARMSGLRRVQNDLARGQPLGVEPAPAHASRSNASAIQSLSARLPAKRSAPNAARISSSSGASRPLSTSDPPGATLAMSSLAIGTRIAFWMLASTSSNVPSIASTGVSLARTRSATPLTSAFSRVTSTAIGSTSIAIASAAPSMSAPIAKIPVPQPTSSTCS